jgi:hypothetical protein
MRPTVARNDSAGLAKGHPCKTVDADVFQRRPPVGVSSRHGDRIARGLQRQGEERDLKVEKISARLQRTFRDLLHLGMVQAR